MNNTAQHYYSDEENTLILVSLLKAHGIKRVIASPGTTNISFVGSVQIDPFFDVFSAVDERAAAFMACCMSEETGEPVVLTCTGATASRNYIPGLTEAYYRNLPILAVTSTQHNGRVGNYVAQLVDRTVQFPDMIKKSYQIGLVHDKEDRETCITEINDAILELSNGNMGPVHINLSTAYSNRFIIKELPKYRIIKRVVDRDFPELPNGKIAIFIGAHRVFSQEETDAIDAFCSTNNAVVLCDHVSNYRGKYRFLASLVNSQALDMGTKNFDLIIYIGYIHGVYLKYSSKELWRVNQDGVIRDLNKNLTYVFKMGELDFFRHYSSDKMNNTIGETCARADKLVRDKIPELPFSNLWIASKTASKLPDNAVLHFSILNSLRAWNYYETPNGVTCYSNTGGYGIDGCMSSFIGSASLDKNIAHYLIVGDLSFFYDLNVLFNEIPTNVHIMVINNGVGVEFKNYNHRAAYFGEEADRFMAAKGHNGFCNHDLVKGLCQNLGINYLCANNKDEYLSKVDKWITDSKPVILEVFTNDRDESNALRMINSIMLPKTIKNFVKKSIVYRIIKGMEGGKK